MAGQTVCPRCGRARFVHEGIPARDLRLPGLPEPARLAGDPGMRPGLQRAELAGMRRKREAGAEPPVAQDQDGAASGGATSNGAPASGSDA